MQVRAGWWPCCTALPHGRAWRVLTTVSALLTSLDVSVSAEASADCPATENPTMAMAVLKVVPAGTTRPFGDHRTVDQAFPAAVPSEDSDP